MIPVLQDNSNNPSNIAITRIQIKPSKTGCMTLLKYNAQKALARARPGPQASTKRDDPLLCDRRSSTCDRRSIPLMSWIASLKTKATSIPTKIDGTKNIFWVINK